MIAADISLVEHRSRKLNPEAGNQCLTDPHAMRCDIRQSRLSLIAHSSATDLSKARPRSRSGAASPNDLDHAQSWSPLLDVRILFLTALSEVFSPHAY